MIPTETTETYGEHKIEELDDGCQKAKRLQRAQWLRAAILGANDGLLSTTSLMLGVGAAKENGRSMILSGLAGAVAGACSMAVGEFVSVSTQRDIEKAIVSSKNIDRELGETDKEKDSPSLRGDDSDKEEMLITNPYKAAIASALSFLFGSSVPMMPAILVTQNGTRMLAIAVVTSMALALFGGLGAYLGGSRIRISALRVIVGGWIAMGITYGLLKPFDNDDNKDSNS